MTFLRTAIVFLLFCAPLHAMKLDLLNDEEDFSTLSKSHKKLYDENQKLMKMAARLCNKPVKSLSKDKLPTFSQVCDIMCLIYNLEMVSHLKCLRKNDKSELFVTFTNKNIIQFKFTSRQKLTSLAHTMKKFFGSSGLGVWTEPSGFRTFKSRLIKDVYNAIDLPIDMIVPFAPLKDISEEVKSNLYKYNEGLMEVAGKLAFGQPDHHSIFTLPQVHEIMKLLKALGFVDKLISREYKHGQGLDIFFKKEELFSFKSKYKPQSLQNKFRQFLIESDIILFSQKK